MCFFFNEEKYIYNRLSNYYNNWISSYYIISTVNLFFMLMYNIQLYINICQIEIVSLIVSHKLLWFFQICKF